jgi:Protein of unknown function (DUF664)
MATELQEYLAFFAEYPQEVGALLDGLTPDALNWRPLATGDQDVTNSLAVLVTHAAGSLEDWVVQVAGGRPVARNRAAEFLARASDTQALPLRLAAACDAARAALQDLKPEQLDEIVPASTNRQVTRRWALFHAVRHCSVHLGHMQLTRQLWEAHHQ